MLKSHTIAILLPHQYRCSCWEPMYWWSQYRRQLWFFKVGCQRKCHRWTFDYFPSTFMEYESEIWRQALGANILPSFLHFLQHLRNKPRLRLGHICRWYNLERLLSWVRFYGNPHQRDRLVLHCRWCTCRAQLLIIMFIHLSSGCFHVG